MTTQTKKLPPQLWIGDDIFDPGKLALSSKHGAWKPNAWLWTSTYLPDGPPFSAWQKWCSENGFDSGPGRVLSVVDLAPARFFTIDSEADLAMFMSRAVPEPRLAGFINRHGLDNSGVDWTATCAAWEIDALRVTDDGHWATRLTYPFSTYSWDCESTAWVNKPTVVSVETLDTERAGVALGKGPFPIAVTDDHDLVIKRLRDSGGWFWVGRCCNWACRAGSRSDVQQSWREHRE